jgi:hypothetical protein
MSFNSTTGEAVVSSDQEIFGAISRALHQTTQPLTVLQGMLELALLKASTVDQYKDVVERSLEELRRATDCFGHLRTLIQPHQPATDITTFAVSSMVKAVVASLKDNSAAAGVELVLQPELGGRKGLGEDHVRMSRSRVSTTLKMALSDLLQLLKSGTKVIVLIETEAMDVLIRVDTLGSAQQGAQVTHIPLELTMPRQELLRAMAASAGVELTFCSPSSGLLIRLPKVPSTSVCCEVERQIGEVARV